MKHAITAVLWLTITQALPLWAGSGIYKWTDAQGQTHYSDDPESSKKAKARELNVPPLSGTSPPLKTEPAPLTDERAPEKNGTQKTAGAAQRAVNINTADAKTLDDTLLGIGLQKAEAIVAYRKQHGPFKSVDGLDQVKGIGSKTIDNNRARMTVR
ncbi:MAG: helix-hairpin-helix domain-containing protein [Gammaproteobacteria bacterium]